MVLASPLRVSATCEPVPVPVPVPAHSGCILQAAVCTRSYTLLDSRLQTSKHALGYSVVCVHALLHLTGVEAWMELPSSQLLTELPLLAMGA